MVTINIDTDRSGLFEITHDVREAIKASGIQSGIAVLWVPHSTAGVTVISRMDELGFLDIENEINRIVPMRIDFEHQYDTPSDAAGHIKSAIIGVSVSLIIEDGELLCSPGSGIFFFEFDGPRKRRYHLQMISA
ncbi:MAG: hypothetical protein BWY11_01421 [Firmicutes bacterium ADurb.Bin182]|nr:MAG: hypothetical protein BWY11_01421 [Firmicutes bacterium ADurb.Bin182]